VAELPTVALIAGPTASGKSALALALAEKHRGTVINADSMQVYADLRILTARPTAEEEARVPHRLFGHVDGADALFGGALGGRSARRDRRGASRRPPVPILVGGTGMYLRTLARGHRPRARDRPCHPQGRCVRCGVAEAHAQLAAADPAAAAKLNPRHARASPARSKSCVDRQAARRTGRSSGWAGSPATIHLAPLILLPDRDWLGDRIDRASPIWSTGAPKPKRCSRAPICPADAPVDARHRRARTARFVRRRGRCRRRGCRRSAHLPRDNMPSASIRGFAPAAHLRLSRRRGAADL
jgi:tRNA dimethylallyltransferase